MPDSTMLDAALGWAQAGFPVFPCSPKAGPGGKRPLTPKETSKGAKDGGLYLATTDEKQIRAWWTKWPKALIGLPTGAVSGTAVIDLDPDVHDADLMRQTLETWSGGLDEVDAQTGEVREPVVSITPSGGIHLWFRASEPDMPNRVNVFRKPAKDGLVPEPIASHVDSRGDGGYVIAPPSVLDDGTGYRWIAGTMPRPDSLPAVPPKLLDVIRKRGEFFADTPRRPGPRRDESRGTASVGNRPKSGDAVDRARQAYAAKALDNARARVASAPSGSRNQTLNNEALALGHLVGAGLLGEGEVRGVLEDAAVASGLAKDDGIDQCRKTIASGLSAGIAEPADLSAIGAKAGRSGERPPTPEMDDYGQGGSGVRRGSSQPRQTHDGPNAGDRLDGDNSDAPLSSGSAEFADPSLAHNAPRGAASGKPDVDVVEFCATLDHSDTDNAIRLDRHFGADLLVLAQAKARAPLWGVWTGDHWDFETGGSRAFAIAQKVGGRIALESEHVTMTQVEQKAYDAGEAFLNTPDKRLEETQLHAKDLAKAAMKAFEKRIERKFAWAVTSKNKGRIEAMLTCHAPHCLMEPEAFNADPLTFATRNATVAFDRDGAPHGAAVRVTPNHRRGDLITQIVPVDYDRTATCPKWSAFMTRMLPDEKVRRLVQTASGLGLIGLTVQKLFFHYGAGANGKSVYMETLCRLLGDAAVTLPASSFFGEGGSGGAASPDIARLYGRRHLRVKEIPAGEDLREELVKEVTGGEELTARDLFSGYFDFRPIFTAHMSGNGYPRITGTDNGIWRRMAVIHWPTKIGESEQRDFEDMMAEFEPEYPGILNWLIDGVTDYLDAGELVIPDAVKAATQEYRDEMDPTSAFCAACIEPVPGNEVAAKDLYAAFCAYVRDQGGRDAKPISLVRFGKAMQAKYERHHDGRSVTYRDISLVSVPGAPPDGVPDYPDDYGGRM